MIPAIVDISGLNRISRGVFARAPGPSVECWTPRRTARPRPRMLF